MKRSSLILYLLGISSLLFAKVVDNNQLYSLINYNFPHKTIESTEIINKNLILTHFKNGGFVLSARNDAFPGILAYSEKSRIHGQNPAFLSQCNLYDKQINRYSHIKKSQHPDWNYEQNNSLNKVSKTSKTGPLLTSIWNQAPHYNSKFPNFVLPEHSNEQALVGCVAVVMGQLMKYYEHPSRGYGKRWYYSESTNTNFFADFDTSSYDYENMPDSLCDEYGNLTVPLDQKNDVSSFLLQCATAVEMELLPGASSSAYEDMMYAMRSHFDYSPSMYLYEKTDYNDEEWNTMLQQEIDAAHPIPYRGQGAKGGHAFILDGYKIGESTFYHINWGWGGLYNGWFRLSALEATSDYDFNDYQAAIFNIQANSDNLTRYLHTSFEGLEAGWLYNGGGFYSDQSGYDLARNGEMAYGFDGTDQWLISPRFQVPDHTNASLSMWAYMLYPGRQCTVYLSTSDTNRASFTHVLGTISPTEETWNKYDYSLRTFKNQNVYLGIKYNQNGGYLTVDDIQVTRPKVITNIAPQIPDEFDIINIYPNPFNPETSIDFQLSEAGDIELSIFNISGKKVHTLYQGIKNKGNYSFNWNASTMPSGIYICTLSSNNHKLSSQKLLLVK